MQIGTKYERSKDDYLSREELIIKAQMEQWIYDIWKKAELDRRLQETFANSKSHTKSLSEL